MPAEAWIALATLTFLILNGLFLVVFIAGKHANRIKALEEKAKETAAEVEQVKGDVSSGRAQQASLDATLRALDRTVSQGFTRLEQGIRDAIEQARGVRRRGAAAD